MYIKVQKNKGGKMNLIALMSLLTVANTEDNYVKDHFEDGMDYIEEHATEGEEYFNDHMKDGIDYVEDHFEDGMDYVDDHMNQGAEHINDKTNTDLGTKINDVYKKIKSKIASLFKF